MLRLAAVVALALSVLLPGCGKPLSHAECSELLDHYVDLLAHADQPDAGAATLLHLQVQARAKAARDPSFSQCAAHVSRSQWQCAMKAPDADTLERCLL